MKSKQTVRLSIVLVQFIEYWIYNRRVVALTREDYKHEETKNVRYKAKQIVGPNCIGAINNPKRERTGKGGR